MNLPPLSTRLAVCSWSLRPTSPAGLAQSLLDLGIPRVQLALDPLRNEPAVWGRTAEIFAARQIQIVSGMFGTIGEDYSTLETIKATGGVVPDTTWEQNWQHAQAIAELAASLGLKLVTFHAGFLPHETTDPQYAKLRARIVQLADLFAARGIDLGFETGQETADTLAAFLTDLGKPNVGVNFDPANMLLYAKGDPIAALRTLRPWLKQCHIKDAVQTKVPGTWGEEVPTGTGQVDWQAFFQVLAETGYTGHLSIEREAGEQRATDIQTARDYVLGLPGNTASAPAKTVRVGVIGLGFMGMVHLKAYQQVPGTRIAAIADAFKQPVNGVIPGVGGNITGGDAFQLEPDTKFYKSPEELIADPAVDLVDICVPTSDHVKLSLAALKAGKHVICEKPLARTSALCREIVQGAAQAKGSFMPAMCMRFWPGWDWLKAAITNQTYGKVLAARFRRVSAPPGWSRGTYFKGGESGGALLDLHIHDTDFVQFCFGRPQAVFSSGCTRFSGAIDHVATTYHVEGGAVVTAEGSWIMNEGFPFTMTYTVNFEKATADFDISRGADALKLYEEGQPAATVKLGEGDGYIGELRHLVESIQQGVRPSIVTAADGASAVEICEAEERSAQTGQVVKL